MPWALSDWTEWSTLFISAPVRWAKCVLLTSHSSFYYQREWLLSQRLDPRTKCTEDNSEFLALPSHLCKSQSLSDSLSEVSRPYPIVFCSGLPCQAVPRFWNHQKRKRNFCTSKHHSRFCPCPPSPPFCSLNFFAQTIIILNSLSFSILICRIYMIVKVPIHLKSTLKYP